MFKTNEYFDGKVKSIAFSHGNDPATIGVMAAGKYEFGTSTVEIMHVISGSMDIQHPGTQIWQTYKEGDAFTVNKDVTFGVRVKKDTAYLCIYQ